MDKKKILDFIFKFKKRVKEEGWIPSYDVEADSFAYHVKNLPNDVRKRYFGNEIALYLTPNSEVKGVFIEYYLSNFLTHHESLAELKKEIEKKAKENKDVIRLNETKMKESLFVLETLLQESFSEKTTSNFQ